MEIELAGSWSNYFIKYLEIKLLKCNAPNFDGTPTTRKCANDTDIERVFEFIELSVAVLQQYFDSNDKSENPIKNSIEFIYVTANSLVSNSYEFKIS